MACLNHEWFKRYRLFPEPNALCPFCDKQLWPIALGHSFEWMVVPDMFKGMWKLARAHGMHKP